MWRRNRLQLLSNKTARLINNKNSFIAIKRYFDNITCKWVPTSGIVKPATYGILQRWSSNEWFGFYWVALIIERWSYCSGPFVMG